VKSDKEVKLDKKVTAATQQNKTAQEQESKVQEAKKEEAKAEEEQQGNAINKENNQDKLEAFNRHEKTDDTLREARKAAFKNATAVDNNTVHFFDYDNAKQSWNNDWAAYRNARDAIHPCKIPESDNFLGAQQCRFNWECRGARTCERGGWCTGFDGCEGSALPLEAPGLEPDF